MKILERKAVETEGKVDNLIASVARIEEQLNHMATKEDVANLEKQIVALENKFLWRVVGLMITAIAAIAAILRYLAP